MDPFSRAVHVGRVLRVPRTGILGGYPGGNTEGYTGTQHPTAKGGPDSEAGPVGPPLQGEGWSGWSGPTDPGVRPPVPPAHPCGARSVLWPSLAGGLAPRAAGARFDVISHKVSQNAEVSPKCVEKA